MKKRLFIYFGFCFAIAAFLVVDRAEAGETYVQLVARLSSAGAAEHIFQPQLEAELFDMANAFRQSHGLPALQSDPKILTAARAHAADMLHHHFLGHNASTGQDFDSRMRALRGGAMILPAMGENAVKWKSAHLPRDGLAQKLFQSWVNSPDHRHTLLSRDYLKVSTGVAMSSNEIYADQIFTGPEVITNMQRVTQ
jgi:uncharacterized protein YkwD